MADAHLTNGPTSFPKKVGLYDPANEKDACGIGFIADLTRNPTRSTVVVRAFCSSCALGAAKAGGRGAGGLRRPRQHVRMLTTPSSMKQLFGRAQLRGEQLELASWSSQNVALQRRMRWRCCRAWNIAGLVSVSPHTRAQTIFTTVPNTLPDPKGPRSRIRQPLDTLLCAWLRAPASNFVFACSLRPRPRSGSYPAVLPGRVHGRRLRDRHG